MKTHIDENKISDHNLKAEKRTKEEIEQFIYIMGKAAFCDKARDEQIQVSEK